MVWAVPGFFGQGSHRDPRLPIAIQGSLRDPRLHLDPSLHLDRDVRIVTARHLTGAAGRRYQGCCFITAGLALSRTRTPGPRETIWMHPIASRTGRTSISIRA